MGQKKFNTLAMLSMQHDFGRHSKQLETRNWGISDFNEFKTTENSEKN